MFGSLGLAGSAAFICGGLSARRCVTRRLVFQGGKRRNSFRHVALSNVADKVHAVLIRRTPYGVWQSVSSVRALSLQLVTMCWARQRDGYRNKAKPGWVGLKALLVNKTASHRWTRAAAYLSNRRGAPITEKPRLLPVLARVQRSFTGKLALPHCVQLRLPVDAAVAQGLFDIASSQPALS